MKVDKPLLVSACTSNWQYPRLCLCYKNRNADQQPRNNPEKEGVNKAGIVNNRKGMRRENQLEQTSVSPGKKIFVRLHLAQIFMEHQLCFWSYSYKIKERVSAFRGLSLGKNLSFEACNSGLEF